MGGTATFPPPTSSQPTPATKPASGGLKQCWDLKEPQLGEVGSSEQAKKFSQAFKAAIDPVNKCLQYTKCNAEKEKHEAMVAKRDYQYTNYQSVQGQIDPKDEAKAKGPIDQYLNQTRALAGEANTLKQQTEKSVNAWKAKEGAFDKAVLQVEELRDFKFKDLKAHSDLATEIQTAVNVHKFDDAVAKFGQLATNLPPAYEEYKKQKQAKEYREKKWKDLKPRIDNLVADKPPIGNACQELDNANKEMDQAVFNEDWQAAKTRVDELSTKLEQHEKTYKQRAVDKKYYDEKWPALKTEIDKFSGAPFEETKTRVAELNKAKTEIPGFATSGQYDKARPLLEKLPADLEKLKQMLHTLYGKTWAEMKKQLPTSSQQGSPKEAELQKQLLELSTKVESTAASGDYVAALKQIPDVEAKFKELKAERAANENRKKDFEKKFADMKTGLDMALATKTDVPEVKATQDAVKAKKSEAETAAKAGDYAAGMTKLNELDAAIKAHQEEEKKKPHKCTWVSAAAGLLSEKIKEKYLEADTRIKRAADGYDAALKAQKEAIDAVRALKQLAVDIAMGVFFAGLGGAAGGAVGGALKKPMEATFKSAVASGAVIDAGKDVAKWTARTLEKFGGGKLDKDPLEGLPKVGGDGTALARSIGVAINAQAIALGKDVQKLYKFVMDNEAKCEAMTVRVEEPNYAAFDSDPFLTALGTIANIDQEKFQKVFAQILWAKWIETEAYSVGRICSEYDCAKYTVDNFDDFFARWAKLRNNVEQQTGQDFGLQAKLDAARAEVQKKVDEANKQ